LDSTELTERGALVKTSDVKKKWAFVPAWVLSHSEVLDHIFEGEEEELIEYSALGVKGVTKSSINDCVLLYKLSKQLIAQFGSQDFKWQYNSKNREMDTVLKTVYRWRSRLGYLISTAGFFGWRMLQNLGDAVMKFRVSTSYSKNIKELILFTYRDDLHKTESLLDFFVEKLKYDKIHFDMIGSWITQTVLNEWMSNAVFCSGDSLAATEAFDYMTRYLNFKPLFWRRISIGWSRTSSVVNLLTATTEKKFKESCHLLESICDTTPFIPATIVTFYHDHFLFKLIWQVSEELFVKIITNIRRFKTSFVLIPDDMNAHPSYRQYFQQLFASDRPAVVFPPPYILARWTDLLDALNAPADSLEKILKFFPRHSKFCAEPMVFRT